MRLFLAAPHDLADARDAVKRAVARHNQQLGLTPRDPRFVVMIDWQRHVASLLDVPRDGRSLAPDLASDDLVVGIAWLRFDRPESLTKSDAVGCEESAFQLAEQLRAQGAARCRFYRCLRLPASLLDIDAAELGAVERFFAQLEADHQAGSEADASRDTEALPEHGSFAELDALEERIGRDLTTSATPLGATAVADAQGEDTLQPGHAYEVSFLNLGIVEQHGQIGTGTHDDEQLRARARGLEELARSAGQSYGGVPIRWWKNGGTLMFWRDGHRDHAVMTGLKILHSLPIFNLDARQNPSGLSVVLRAAVHDAVVVHQGTPEDIASGDLDLAVEIQESMASPGELAISQRVREQLDVRLKTHFSFKGRHAKEPIYACQLPGARTQVDPTDLENRVEKLTTALAMLGKRIAGTAESGGDDEPLGIAVDRAYGRLNRFCAAYGNLDDSWSPDFLEALDQGATELVKAELRLWHQLRTAVTEAGPEDATLQPIVRAASRRRSRPVIILAKLAQRCRMLARAGAEGEAEATPEEARSTADVDRQELATTLAALLRADELDIETVLTDLLLHHKRGLIAYLDTTPANAERDQLCDTLWRAADLVLLDDLYSIRDQRRAGAERLFDTLTGPQVGDPRFRLVRALLARKHEPTEETVATGMANAGSDHEKDRQVVWRCMVLGHPDATIRSSAAFQLTLYATWQTIAHPRIPLASLYAVGERVNKRESEDAKRIFFDCVRGRLKTSAETFRSQAELEALTRIVLLLLDFRFLVETGYFERFDDILETFLARAKRTGLKVEYFENLRQRLETARHADDGKGATTPPSGLKRLPPTLQRRLAGEARYLFWFVVHPDPRIAGETMRHIGLKNVERVLRLREVNGSVMATLLRRPELFTRQQTLLTALNHPKCGQAFASRHLGSLGRSTQGRKALTSITRNPSANPVVRAGAKRLLGRARTAR